ncbi:MAG: hypothetical protein HKN20_06125 [Gemmatimonadetes bacterium]|nr:hypothetical protein [Gemmatimonadota bacterium]
MTTFHVVYTAGTTELLLPFAFSLLQSPSARFLLVDNGCSPEESDRMRLTANAEERFSYYRLPFDRVVRHGIALDHLFERSDESTFAIIDSDILASGDFLTELEDRPPACGAVCTGWPVWIEDREAICGASQPFLGGPYRTLADGTAVGGTGCAIYDRGALQAALKTIGAGFRNRMSRSLDGGARDAFAARGWRFTRYGTARVAHLELVRQGNAIVNRDCAQLHHLGGLSHTADITPRGSTRKWKRTAALLMRGERSAAINLVTNVKRRLTVEGRRQAGVYARKKRVVMQVSAWMQSLRRGKRAEEAVPTGSAEVDTRFSLMRAALGDRYPALCDRVRALERPGRPD